MYSTRSNPLSFQDAILKSELFETAMPLSPFFKGGISSAKFKTPLWKRGEGEIFDETAWPTYIAEFWISTGRTR
jgi:hypothetical protein